MTESWDLLNSSANRTTKAPKNAPPNRGLASQIAISLPGLIQARVRIRALLVACNPSLYRWIGIMGAIPKKSGLCSANPAVFMT